MKHFEFEYGAGTMGAELPDYTDEFIPGVTVPDPTSWRPPTARASTIPSACPP